MVLSWGILLDMGKILYLINISFNQRHSQMNIYSFLLSVALQIMILILARMLTPVTVTLPKEVRYLNINMAYGLSPDAKKGKAGLLEKLRGKFSLVKYLLN